MHEAYSHEVSSCGFWPGGSEEGSFYTYAYPEPAGFAEQPAGPAAAYYDAELERIHPSRTVPCGPRPTPMRSCLAVPAEHVRGGGDYRALGPRRPSKRVSKVSGHD